VSADPRQANRSSVHADERALICLPYHKMLLDCSSPYSLIRNCCRRALVISAGKKMPW